MLIVLTSCTVTFFSVRKCQLEIVAILLPVSDIGGQRGGGEIEVKHF